MGRTTKLTTTPGLRPVLTPVLTPVRAAIRHTAHLAAATLLVLAALLLPPAPANAQAPGVDFTAPGQTVAINCCSTLGYQFTANTNVAVIGLATYNSWNTDGGGAVQVGLWNALGTLLASTTVQQNSFLIGTGNWAYELIKPVTLSAGQNYYVASSGTNGNFTFDTFGFSTNPQITFVADATNDSGLQFPSGTTGVIGTFGGNIILPTATNIVSPLSFLGSTVGGGTNPIFQGGTLQLDQAGATYAMGFTLDNSLTNTIDQTGLTATFSGVFSDADPAKPGNIVIANSSTGGRIVFSGVNTYTGTTTINTGATLALSGTGSIAPSAGVVANGGLDISATTAGAAITTLSGASTGGVILGAQTLTLTAASGTFAGTISGTGSLVLSSGTEILTGANTYTGGTTITSGSLQIGNGTTAGSILGNVLDNAALIYNHADTVTLATITSGPGTLTQAGTGKLILNGVNTYTGLTTIAAGSLMVGDAAHPGARITGAVTVGAGTLLQGHGTILGAVTNTGTVAPGGSIGTLTVGTFTQGSSGTLAIEISPTANSRLASTGPASLNGTVALTFDPGTYTTHAYQILTGTPVTGRFSTVTLAGLPTDLVAGIIYNPNAVEADLLLADPRPATIYSNANTQAVNNGQAFATSMIRMLAAANTCAATGTIANHGATMAGANQSACAEHSHAWMTPFAGAATSGNAGRSGFDSTTAGIAGGADRTFDQGITIGFAGQYAQDRITAARDTSRAQLTSYHLGAYSRIPVGDLKFDAAAFYATTTSTISRDTIGAGIARATPSGHGAGAAIQVSYDLRGGDIAPYAGLRIFNYSRQGATETNVTPLGFAIHAASLTSIRADLGLRLQHSYQVGTLKLTPQIWLGLEQEFGSTRNATTGNLAFAQGADFSVSPKTTDRTMATAEIRLGADLTDSFQLYLDLNTRAGPTTRQATAIFGGQLRF